MKILGGAVLFLSVAIGCPQAVRADEKAKYAKDPVVSESKPRPSPTPSPKSTPDEEEEEIRANHRYLGEPVRGRPLQSTLFVGREIPVPTGYTAPRVYTGPDGRQVVQPATPRSFEVRKTGVTIDSRGGFEQTELEGFIDYGSPIRTVVPVYNEKGEVVGTAVQEHPNPILQPVFRTIRR
jgi:hypothetical protein